MNRSIAFFDFDGTITTRDTFLEIIKFQKGKLAFYSGFTLLSPWLICMKLGIISNTSAKEKVLTYFFGKTPLKEFQIKCDAFISQKLPQLIRPQANETILKHKEQGIQIVVVSASPENWLKGWCVKNGLDLISSRLEVKNELLTGKLEGKNCHGEEKVIRIREKYELTNFTSIYCYGDTKGDKPMLELATFAYYKPFRS
ncbi:MAG: HAD-IB family hydrolase [Bacteroidetes bacterium]|nr:MAG: HAD-IB family hydrolase [Bacteroidota bacterium]